MSVVVISFCPGPVIQIVSMLGICLGSVPAILAVSMAIISLVLACESGGHEFGS